MRPCGSRSAQRREKTGGVWCTPSFAWSAAAAPEAVPAMGGMAPEDARLISQGEISFRFRCLELLEDLLGYFRVRGEGIPTSE